MEKKFKNKLAVTDPISLRKAFEEELIKLGYKNTSYYKDDYEEYPYIFTPYKHDSDIGGFGNYVLKNGHIELNLPLDWDYALQLAAEVEEEIPEYVECIKVPKSWIEDSVYVGSIYKTESYKDGKYRLVFKDGSGQTTYRVEDHFKPSTKEAYDAQFKLKPEVGKWYTLKDSLEDNVFYVTSVTGIGNCYGYGFYDGVWFSSLDNNSSNCACNEVAFKSRARLATDEEVKNALLKYANQHYPIGTKYLTINQNINKVVKDEFKIYSSKEIGCYITDGWGGAVLKNGQWAEILPKEVKVNDYILEKIDFYNTKVGCKTFENQELYNLYNFLKNHEGVYMYDGKSWDYQDVKKLIDFIETK